MRRIFFSITSEAMLGCTQEEIGRGGLCVVCINGCLRLFSLRHHPLIKPQLCLSSLSLQPLVVDDGGYVNVHGVFCSVVTKALSTLIVFFFYCVHSLCIYTFRFIVHFGIPGKVQYILM